MSNKFAAILLPFAFANSPSGCAIFCIAVGEIPQGKDNLEFNTMQLASRIVTSRRNLGRIRNLEQTDNNMKNTQNLISLRRHKITWQNSNDSILMSIHHQHHSCSNLMSFLAKAHVLAFHNHPKTPIAFYFIQLYWEETLD